MAFELTPAQARAIHTHDRNLIVVAGAGSGKTFVLVSRYLALLEAHPDWSLNQLVAITFTEKAAGEMRDRVRRELEQRVNTATDEAAIARWTQCLAEMNSARISTIHGLCAALLKTNAAEAGVDPGFEVADEIDARVIRDDAIDAELRAMVAAGHPALTLFTEYGTKNVRDVIADFISSDLPVLPDDLMAEWRARYEADVPVLLDQLHRDPQWQQCIAGPPNLPTHPSDKLVKYWQSVFTARDRLYDVSLPHHERLAALADLTVFDLRVGSKNVWGADGLKDAKHLLSTVRTMADSVLKQIGEPPGALDDRAADLLPLWVELIGRMRAAYDRAKADANVLDFDDLESRALRLLDEHPSARARYQNREFKHVLVDEFQDTNATQWALIQRIADPTDPERLFIVGDAKQSIYAFRGADVSVFERVRAELCASGGADVEIALAQSFRTHQPLIDLFNALFEQILTRDPNSPVAPYQIERGEPMTAGRDTAPSADTPLLELVLFDPASTGQAGRLNADEMRRWEAHELAARIKDMVDREQPVYDKSSRATRPVRYGDVALLFQSMGSVTIYEAAFKAAGLRYVTVAGRGYYSRQEVWDLLDLLNALYNPLDDLSLAAALRSPLFGFSDDVLLALRLLKAPADDEPMPLWDALSHAVEQPVTGLEDADREQIAFAANCLHTLRAMAGRMTIAELLREALRLTGYLAVLSALPDGDRKRGNIEKLLEMAQQSGKITLGAFSQHLRDLSEHEAREGEALVDVTDAVTLMTVHKSKGLEFPVVVLPDAGWTRTQSDANILMHDPIYGLACKAFDETTNKPGAPYALRQAEQLARQRDEAERRRLLYVAMTRAQDYLIVSGRVKSDRDSDRWQAAGWLGWLLEALGMTEIEARAIADYSYAGSRVRVCFPSSPPPADEPMIETDTVVDDVTDAPYILPSLLLPLRIEHDAPARSLTATQVADLGGARVAGRAGAFYRRRFRRHVLHAAPAHIGRVSTYRRKPSARKIGEIVHQMLRWWNRLADMDDAATDKLLKSYAWQQGFVDVRNQDRVISSARELLQKVQNSDVFVMLDEARRVYTELPFVYRTDKRIIHGVIDVLLQQPDGSWAIIDYKTSDVPRDLTHADHAARYHLQVGVYAAAAREQLRATGAAHIVPAVYIHYIREAVTLPVPQTVWEAALQRIEDDIGNIVGSA